MEYQSLYYTLLSPKGGTNYINEGVIGKEKMILNTRIDRQDYTYTNRIGIVESVPLTGAPFKKGDEVLVHHNVFRQFWNQEGRLHTSSNLVRDNLFTADDKSIYAFREPQGCWNVLDGYQLVKPIEDGLSGLKMAQRGVVAHGSLQGSEVMFNEDCEYEFYIDDTMYYRIFTHDISAKIL